MPTTSVTSAWSITDSAAPPRAVFTDFPLGNTAGPPHEPETQLAIIRSALAQLHANNEPGTIVSLGHAWSEPWKAEARELRDHRSERLDTPQYQEPADRAAAVDRHGEAATVAPTGD